ncbi:hypothetical protein LSUE1_G006119 [Lachnellula suecica]|uniref:Uncharacterized protein n=1 Tax=Lachnellula suecica TaxID=602035 RepID=A0A8T9BZ53_9HELO|nr:hypothetical protein LSUE1_G006119 [Lachnellula suecica]
MAREGTRSTTGSYLPYPNVAAASLRYSPARNSRPRVFDTVPEVTTTTKKPRASANIGAKRGPKKAIATKASKPTGVTKKKAAPAKKTSVATKAKGVVKKAEGAITGNPEKKAAGTKKIKGTDGSVKAKAAPKKK